MNLERIWGQSYRCSLSSYITFLKPKWERFWHAKVENFVTKILNLDAYKKMSTNKAGVENYSRVIQVALKIDHKF